MVKKAVKKATAKEPAAKAKKVKSPKKTKTVSETSAEKEPVAKAKKGKKGKAASPAEGAGLAGFYASAVDDMESDLRLRSGAAQMPTPLSSGVLMVDYVMGGGAHSCFTQIAGAEASGKSTTAMMVLASAIRANVPMVIFIDAEGSLSAEYCEQALGAFNLGNVFKSRRVRYYRTNVIEDTSAIISGLLKKMPDKSYLHDHGTWAYIVPKGSSKHKPLLEGLAKAGLKPNNKMSTPKDWVIPTDYAGPEAVVIVDSWAAMIPRTMDEQEGDLKGGGMAINARTFSREIPRFAGQITAKAVALWSVNQLRQVPGVMYGDPERESGGKALEYASGMRARMRTRAVPQGFVKDKEAGQLGVEPSVTHKGKRDRYAYKSIANTKSKYGPPALKGMLRVWVSDGGGDARGFDPVYDVFEFGRATGQLVGPTKKIVFTPITGKKALPEALKPIIGKPISYAQLKAIVIAEHFASSDKELSANALKASGFKAIIPLRKFFFTQMATNPAVWKARDKGADDAESDETSDSTEL